MAVVRFDFHEHDLMRDARSSNICDSPGCGKKGTAFRCKCGCDFDVCESCFQKFTHVKYRVGALVKGLYSNGIWYPARIAKVLGNNRFLLNWEDKDTRQREKSGEQLVRFTRTALAVGKQVTTALGHEGFVAQAMKHGEVGEIIEDDGTSIPYKVKFRGHTFWAKACRLQPFEINVVEMTSASIPNGPWHFFSAGQGKQNACSIMEGIVLGTKLKELRLKSVPTQSTFKGFTGQLRVNVNNKAFVGTAHVCTTSGKSGSFLLTCGHNFLHVDKDDGSTNEAQSAEFYLGLESATQYRSKHKVTGWVVHPQYQSKPSICSGYDFAIAKFDSTGMKDKGVSPDSKWESKTHECLKAGTSIKVTGYPGEKTDGQYEMSGHVHEAKQGYYLGDQTDGSIVTYTDLNTTGGQSGSPLTTEVNGIHMVIGVHVGYIESQNANVATLLTPDIQKWISEVQDKWEQDK